MPGFADLFDDEKLFHKSIAMPIALMFSSPAAIRSAGVAGIASRLTTAEVRFHTRTIERIVAWSGAATEPSELAEMYTRQWRQLNEVRQLLEQHIAAAELEMAGLLVKTPYVLLLSITGINVVSAARLAGEAGPIEHYASARAINGRAGLYPSRYQSDQVDHPDGSLVRQCNRQLRGAAMLVAENLIKCHPYYRGLSALWAQQNVDPRDRRCRIANRAMRMVYQLVGGRQVWRGRGVEREDLLAKLQEFHRLHRTPIDQAIRDLNEAFAWLPKSVYTAEAKPLADFVRKHRKLQRIGDLMFPLLIRLGLTGQELGVPRQETVESNTSEARGSA
jgi:transposase